MDLKKIIEKYDNFILDVWGILHDGVNAIPHSIKFVDELQALNKKFCILSNAPRPKETVHAKLVDLGFKLDKEAITTSGDFFLSCLHEYSKEKFYVLGEELNTDLLKGIEINRTESLEQAQYILVLLYANSEKQVAAQKQILERSAREGLKMICVNPDISAQHGSSITYTQGTFAKIYKDLGGDVIYFGKPHQLIYEYLFNKYRFDKQNTLMIGDSLATDIRGASNYGFDSMMVLTGIHANEQDLKSQFINYNCKPTYVLDNLKF